MAVDASGIRKYFGNYIGQQAGTQEATAQSGSDSDSALLARINALTPDEQTNLADALSTGNYWLSPSTQAAKELYDKAVEQAKFVAAHNGISPDSAEYNDRLDQYAKQFYDQNIGLGLVSYEQAMNMANTWQAEEAKRKDNAYAEWKKGQTRSSGTGFNLGEWVKSWELWNNPRAQDIYSHVTGDYSDNPNYVPSSNPNSAKSAYEKEFEDYYNNLPKD